ncbi:MAG: DUF2662 domain-containing protein [Actinomycetota bacterium]|nr:MAG: DUF2662 domain-containing protein [Actinomycetota bacterium]
MGLLDRFEQRLDRLVNGAFAKAFKAEVQPVEVAAALQRETDDRAAVVSRGRTVVPNVFDVDLSAHDHDRLAVYATALQAELADMVREHAEQQHYTFLGAVQIALNRDAELDTGIFRVRSDARADVVGAPQPRPADTPPPAITARLVAGGTAHPLTTAVTRLGRGTDTDIRVDDPGVSRHHAEIVLGPPTVIRDLGSTNGTFVNGHKVTETALIDGASIQLGSTTLVFRSG